MSNITNRILRRGMLAVTATFAFAVFGMIPLHAAETPVAPDTAVVVDTTLGTPNQLQSDKRLNTIMNLATQVVLSQHYSRRSLDSEVGANFFKEYLRTLDPARIFFLESEVADLRAKYGNNLHTLIRMNNPQMTGLAFDAYNILTKRLAHYYKYASKIAETPATFDTDELFLIDRKDAPWPKDEAELENLWRQRTLNELLTSKIAARSVTERQLKDSPMMEVKPWNQMKEAEQIEKRIRQLYSFFNGRNALDITEMYISAFTRVFDPHSAYMAPKTEENFNIVMGLQLIGIGAELTVDDGYIKIARLIPGGPAARSKQLKVNDRITAVAESDSEFLNLVNMPLDRAVNYIRGKEKSIVRLSVIDAAAGLGSTPKEVSLIREKVVLKDAEARADSYLVDDGQGGKLLIGVITLPSFYRNFTGNGTPKNAYDDVKKLLTELTKAKVNGVILDLRNNGGGALMDAVMISGLFIRSGTVVQIRNRDHNIERMQDHDRAIQYDGPLVIMQNKFSASASEILAAAMQDYHRAIIVGDRETHGKGTVQEVRDLNKFAKAFNVEPPIGAVKFTLAKFYRANGASTQIEGVRPDIVYPSFSEHIESNEACLEYALPFDTVFPSDLESYIPDYETTKNALREKSEQRMTESDKFKVLREQIDFIGKIRNEKHLSLNEAKRWELYKKEKEINDRQAELLRVNGDDTESDDAETPDEILKAQADKRSKDIYLDETLNVIRDLCEIEKNRKQATP